MLLLVVKNKNKQDLLTTFGFICVCCDLSGFFLFCSIYFFKQTTFALNVILVLWMYVHAYNYSISGFHIFFLKACQPICMKPCLSNFTYNTEYYLMKVLYHHSRLPL